MTSCSDYLPFHWQHSARHSVDSVSEKLTINNKGASLNQDTLQPKVIGLVLPHAQHSYYRQIIDQVLEKSRDHNYEACIRFSRGNINLEWAHIRHFKEIGVKGVLLSLTGTDYSDHDIERLNSLKIPIVFLDAHETSNQFPSVSINEHKSIIEIVNKLVADGFSRFVYLGPMNVPSYISARRRCFKNAVADHHDVKDFAELECNMTVSGAYEAMTKHLRQSLQKQAIFCADDIIALGAYRAACEQHLTVPEDIALAGSGHCGEAFFLPCPYLIVERDTHALTSHSLELLFEQMRPGCKSRTILLHTDHCQI